MVSGKELAAGSVEQTGPLSSDGNIMRTVGRGIGFPGWVAAKLCRLMESRAPVGYEDKGGFLYGADVDDWFFTI
jgi:hypothetical protein